MVPFSTSFPWRVGHLLLQSRPRDPKVSSWAFRPMTATLLLPSLPVSVCAPPCSVFLLSLSTLLSVCASCSQLCLSPFCRQRKQKQPPLTHTHTPFCRQRKQNQPRLTHTHTYTHTYTHTHMHIITYTQRDKGNASSTHLLLPESLRHLGEGAASIFSSMQVCLV